MDALYIIFEILLELISDIHLLIQMQDLPEIKEYISDIMATLSPIWRGETWHMLFLLLAEAFVYSD